MPIENGRRKKNAQMLSRKQANKIKIRLLDLL